MDVNVTEQRLGRLLATAAAKYLSPTHNHQNHSSPATATTSKRRATKQAPRASPSSPASVDTVFVEIGNAQLSQVTILRKIRTQTGSTLTERQTD